MSGVNTLSLNESSDGTTDYAKSAGAVFIRQSRSQGFRTRIYVEDKRSAEVGSGTLDSCEK